MTLHIFTILVCLIVYSTNCQESVLNFSAAEVEAKHSKNEFTSTVDVKEIFKLNN